MTPTAVEQAARTLLDHRDRGLPNPLATSPAKVTDVDSGYAVQSASEAILSQERGLHPVGYKIAVSNVRAREMMGVSHPLFGRMYRERMSTSPAEMPFVAGFHKVYEPEIGIRLARDLPDRGRPYDAADLEEATAAVMPAIEIVGTWWDPWTAIGAGNLVADNAAFDRWIVGPETVDWSGIDLLDLPVALRIGGVSVGAGVGRNVDGGAFGAAAWLANELIDRGRMLRAGEFVTTGIIVMPPVPIEAPQDVVADFGALGRVALRVG